jgi:hypothetical protein
MAITIAPLTATVMGAVGEAHAGTASGINNAVARVASLLAVAVFGLVMTAAFSEAFRGGLGEGGLPEELAAAMELERLAAATPPAHLPAGLRAQLVEVRDAEFVAGFRAVMGLATALAVAGAVVAWAMVEDGKRLRGQGGAGRERRE